MLIPIQDLAGESIDPFSLLDPDERARLLRAAETDVSILILGETGTGKGQLARAIADRSRRRALVEVNCAALPEELLGSELFGHKRGSFTGATSDRKGILMAAAGKTVFLDEIGEISPNMQRMLLRVAQRSNRTIKPLGADTEFPLPPLRFLFATNRNLEVESRAGRFREDLLRRIDVVSVTLPPLREMPKLIQGYAGKFLAELSKLHNIRVSGLDRRALELLKEHPWPGNVRELKNVLERALVTAPREKVVSLRVADIRWATAPGRNGTVPALTMSHAESEAENIRRVVREAKGNIARAARVLGFSSRSSLYIRMKKYGITMEGNEG
ncbi:MAG: sigma 54-interacting transcriptional regulator [Candidatus Hydrogenedentota bacterium]